VEGTRCTLYESVTEKDRGERTGTHTGRRCRGQGTSLKSWGVEYRKLRIWGMKKRRRVLEKWPRMPTTAKVMPAK
jgi:hypothetical protein